MNIRQLVIVFLMGLCLLGKGGELCATEKEDRNYMSLRSGKTFWSMISPGW